MSPTNWTGASLRAGVGAQRALGRPAKMTASAPATGSNAAVPGNGVALVKTSPAAAMASSPSHESTLRRRLGEGGSTGSRASSPPAPNSHARVGVTKYAAAGLVAVAHKE